MATNESDKQSKKQKLRNSRRCLTVGTWNVRTLVESVGDERICRKVNKPGNHRNDHGMVDRKLDLLARELKRYGVSIAGIQETKWFGNDVWPADGYTFLHSGRPLPSDQERAARNEGVGIALDKEATAAWKNAGEVWEAVSSRVVMARLKWAGVMKKKHGRHKRDKDMYVSVICVYAPTAKAPPGIKQKFFAELQDALDKIPESDILVVLGDFNARVGILDQDSNLWRGILGRHGMTERNLAGHELLEFCAINNLSIMNTWFQKKEIHQGTWTHPATKRCHTIDFVIMRAEQRVHCKDVRATRGANCWTDHVLVRAKLTVGTPPFTSRKGKSCMPFAVHELSTSARRDEYREQLELQLQDRPHNDNDTSEQNWEALKHCIVTAAEETVGRGKAKKPEWFEECSECLVPLIVAKNEAHLKALQSNTAADRKEFRKHQRIVKKAVEKAKEDWICRVAKEAEAAVKDGRARWDSIRRLQQTHAGRRPTKPSAVFKEDGDLAQGPSEVATRWYQHFLKVLNIPSEYRDDVIDNMPLLAPILELDTPPSEEELLQALSKLKKRKAGGKSGILPELILCGGAELWSRILKLIQQVWEEGRVVGEWQDAVVVPVPKKGDLRHCDNWRGISLLEVVGKIMARIMKERLEVIAGKVLPESQCGFRKERGCVDMIFVARQLIEKAREHNQPLYMLFVDLRKAYDSVPRQALWKVLEKCGVPPKLLSLVKSCHEGMHAEVRVGSTTTEEFEVRNGLRQGCTLAPTLFNIYISTVVANWQIESPEAGVAVLYKHGRKLVGDRTAKARLSEVKVTETQFADDAALYTPSRQSFETSTASFVKVASEWGLTVSTEKTKGMVVGDGLDEHNTSSVQVEGGTVEVVSHFTYLGSNISRDSEVTVEIDCRIAKASRAFGCLRKPIFQDRNLSIATKRQVYRAVVLSVLLYGAETWVLKAQHVKRLNSFHNRCIRTILGVTRYQQWKERITSTHLASTFGMQQLISDFVMEQRLRWLGHLGRMGNDRLPKKVLFGELRGKRPCHGTKRRWRDVVRSDMEAIGAGDRWYELCQDRKEWFELCQKGLETRTRQKTRCAANNQPQSSEFNCTCGRSFRRQGDLTRHKRFCNQAL